MPPKKAKDIGLSGNSNSLLCFFLTTDRGKPNGLLTEFDFKFIARNELQHCCVGITHKKVVVTLNFGYVGELTAAHTNTRRTTTEFNSLGT